MGPSRGTSSRRGGSESVESGVSGRFTRFLRGGSSDDVLGGRGLRRTFRGGSSDEVEGVRGLRLIRSRVTLGFGVGGVGGGVGGVGGVGGGVGGSTGASTGLTLLSEPLGRPAFLLTGSACSLAI